MIIKQFTKCHAKCPSGFASLVQGPNTITRKRLANGKIDVASKWSDYDEWQHYSNGINSFKLELIYEH